MRTLQIRCQDAEWHLHRYKYITTTRKIQKDTILTKNKLGIQYPKPIKTAIITISYKERKIAELTLIDKEPLIGVRTKIESINGKQPFNIIIHEMLHELNVKDSIVQALAHYFDWTATEINGAVESKSIQEIWDIVNVPDTTTNKEPDLNEPI